MDSRISGEEKNEIVTIAAHNDAFYSLYRCVRLCLGNGELNSQLTDEQVHDAHEFVALVRDMSTIASKIKRDESDVE